MDVLAGKPEWTGASGNSANRAWVLTALDVPDDPDTAVRDVFSWSYAALPGAAARLFRLLGLHPGPHIHPPAAARLADIDLHAAQRLLGDLAHAHLLEPAGEHYQVHDLVRAYAAELAAKVDTEDVRRSAVTRLLRWSFGMADSASRHLYPEFLRLPVAPLALDHSGTDDTEASGAWLDQHLPNLLAAVPQAAEFGLSTLTWHLFDALRPHLFARRHLDDLLQIADRALDAARRAADGHAQAVVQIGIGIAYSKRGDPDRAIRHLHEALEHATHSGWHGGRGNAVSNLGVVYWGIGRLADAADCFAQSAALNRESGARLSELLDLANPCITYCELGQLERGRECGERALTIARDAKSRVGEARSLHALGEAYHRLGRLSDASSCFTNAAERYRDNGDRVSEASAYGNLAGVECDQGRYAEAHDRGLAALAVLREAEASRDAIETLIALGDASCALGEYGSAVDYLRQALDESRGGSGRGWEIAALIGLAAAYRHLGDTARARESACSALPPARRVGYRGLEARALTELARIDLADGNLAESAANGHEALMIHRDTGHRLGEGRTHLVLGEIVRRRGDRDTATAHWRRAHQLLSSVGAPEADEAAAMLSRWPAPRPG